MSKLVSGSKIEKGRREGREGVEGWEALGLLGRWIVVGGGGRGAWVERRGCVVRPSGCVCKAKRPAVGAHLLTISPWRVALYTQTHIHSTHFPTLQRAYEEWQRCTWLALLNSEFFQHDNRTVAAKQNVKNYKYNSKGLLNHTSFCQLFGSTLFIKPYFYIFCPIIHTFYVEIPFMFPKHTQHLLDRQPRNMKIILWIS